MTTEIGSDARLPKAAAGIIRAILALERARLDLEELRVRAQPPHPDPGNDFPAPPPPGTDGPGGFDPLPPKSAD